MPPKTRKTKIENSEDSENSHDIPDLKPEPLPTSDDSYKRKIVIGKENCIANSQIIKLRHPKEGFALFRIGEDIFDEVLAVDDGNRSWFYGNSVIGDGSVQLFAPFNPIFVVLPYLIKNKERFMEIEDVLCDDQVEAIKELWNHKKLLDALKNVADVKDVCDSKVVRINEEKLLKWIRGKFEILKNQLSDDVHKSLLENDEAFERYVFSFLSDYLCPEICVMARNSLNIKEAPVSENIDMSMKRKLMDEDDEIPKTVAKVKRNMASRIAASRIIHAGRGIGQPTAFGKRMERLSNRVWGEVVMPTDTKSLKVVRVMSAEPYETKEQLSPEYYPNLPMFHYLTKMLRFHGLFFDDHVIFREVQDNLKIIRGKVVRPPIGQGKRAQLRGKK
ncbi:unnamed protein product [Caenorhabditis bovis]|uniref:Ribonuclease H2 subunit B wHTH domain-containing protein n=1 Tax=Caenorhabditis bovis TaxID=2654633 RepID=A0A8S1EW84_9PELO|nr:unnamed protein product [Caenorhabditis bovis]